MASFTRVNGNTGAHGTQGSVMQLKCMEVDALVDISAKAAKIKAHSDTHPGVLDTLFELVREIMAAKDEIIRELDSAEGAITATTGGKPGGEGYVSGDDSVKLVPRDRWTPFRAD